MTEQKKILILDDEEEFRIILKSYLYPKGYKILEAYDGLSGLNIAETEKPDLIICDIMMPTLTGVEFINQLQENPETKEIHPILRAGIVHYILVAIHPFVEGNGRTTRAFASLILLREDFDIKRFFAIEEHFDDDPAAYYEAFSMVDRQSRNIAQRDLTQWLEYFSHSVAVELVKVKEKVKKLSMDTRLKVKIGKQVALTERQMQLVEYLSNEGSAGMKELTKILPMISEDTILRDLRDLMEKGIIRKEGSTKASRYIMANK